MLTGVARFATARPWWVLAATVFITIVCGGFGAGVQSHLKSGGFVTPTLESVRADQYIQDHFPAGNPNLVAMVTGTNADDPAVRDSARRVVTALRSESAIGIQSYWDTRPDLASALRSKDHRSGLILATLKGDDTEVQNLADKITRDISGTDAGVQIRVGGPAGAFADINRQVSTDLAKAEAIAVPLSLIVLVLVFGSVVAASLPVVIGLFSIVATLGTLRLLAAFTDVSVFALNMTTALGLGLAIDYSLFIVSRYREELGNGLDHRAAIIRSVQTAGRTVLFSALTVALSLTALLVFEQYFLKSFAYSGIAVVATAAFAAVVILPACLMLLGARVDALNLRTPLLRLIGRTPRPTTAPEASRWYRVVEWVMKRAAPVAVITTAILLLLGSPFLSVRFGYPDDRVISQASGSRQVGDMLRHDFAAEISSSAVAVLPNVRDGGAIGTYAAALSKVPHVPAVLSSAGVYSGGAKVAPAPTGMANDAGTYLSITTSADPFSTTGHDQLTALRAVQPPGPVLFGGIGATNSDSVDSMVSRILPAVAIIAVATWILLFLFTGSIVLPVKALLLNLLSLSSTFGAMVWIFQDGHLSGPLGFTATGYLVANMPILMFCLAFGMSMDYEVFLLSRIREEWLASDRSNAANTHAVAMGVARTGRIFTAAAVLVAIVFVAMAASEVSFMQMFGIGLALAVIADATLIRLFLAPALMKLLGRANWWAPRRLAELHRRIGLAEESGPHPGTDLVREPADR